LKTNAEEDKEFLKSPVFNVMYQICCVLKVFLANDNQQDATL